MILKFLAFHGGFEEETNSPYVEVATDEVDLSEILEVMQDFLETAGVEIPEGFRLTIEEDYL